MAGIRICKGASDIAPTRLGLSITSYFLPDTTGSCSFADCTTQSAKASILSAKASPTVLKDGCRRSSVGKDFVGNEGFADSLAVGKGFADTHVLSR